MKKKEMYSILFMLVFLVPMFSITNVSSVAPTITCSGYVKDHYTGLGISGATVTLTETEYV